MYRSGFMIYTGGSCYNGIEKLRQGEKLPCVFGGMDKYKEPIAFVYGEDLIKAGCSENDFRKDDLYPFSKFRETV